MASIFDPSSRNFPRQKPKSETQILERGNGIMLKKEDAYRHKYWVVPLDRSWSANFTSYEDALLFFNIKNAQF
jgi:hypothetical protein